MIMNDNDNDSGEVSSFPADTPVSQFFRELLAFMQENGTDISSVHVVNGNQSVTFNIGITNTEDCASKFTSMRI